MKKLFFFLLLIGILQVSIQAQGLAPAGIDQVETEHQGDWRESNGHFFKCLKPRNPDHFEKVNPILLFTACLIAKELGEETITVTSHCRLKSQHHFCNAIDFYPGRYTGDRCQNFKIYRTNGILIENTDIFQAIRHKIGWGKYFNLTFHLDMRGHGPGRWGRKMTGEYVGLKEFERLLDAEIALICN